MKLAERVAALHSGAWLAWLAAAVTLFSSTRNPWYLLIALLGVAIVLAAYGTQRDERALLQPAGLLKLAALVLPVSAVFNAAWSRAGETALIKLPLNWPLIGGAITLEALAAGALNGLTLLGLIAAFAALNSGLGVRDLVRMTPRAFHPITLVTSIALTYVPVTVLQARAIREAQAIRGHRLRGLRDWLPLFMPLLVGGLERALQLAEAMTARGFSAQQQPTTAALRLQATVLIGLLTLCVGWLVRAMWGFPLLGAGIALSGGALSTWAIWQLSRANTRTVYRVQRWARIDSVVVICAALSAVSMLIAMPGLDFMSLFYLPYPRLSLPAFDPLQALPIFGLLTPALARLRGAA